jgi:hypothetical protein
MDSIDIEKFENGKWEPVSAQEFLAENDVSEISESTADLLDCLSLSSLESLYYGLSADMAESKMIQITSPEDYQYYSEQWDKMDVHRHAVANRYATLLNEKREIENGNAS